MNNPPYAATGLSNVLFGQYAGYFAVSRLLGHVGSAAQFGALYRGDPTVFYLLARMTVALFGAATTTALCLLGKAATDSTTGLMAAGALAVSFIHVRDSHYAVPDIAMPFFVTVAVALAAQGLRTGRRRYLYSGSFSGGSAMAMKWSALPVALSVLGASVAVGGDPQENPIGRLLHRSVLLSVLVLALGFAVGSPQVLANPAAYVREALGQYGAGKMGGFGSWRVDTVPGWFFYLETLGCGVGLVLLALAIAGSVRRLLLAAGAERGMSLLLLSFPMLYFGLMGSTRHYFARYAQPLVPFAALFAAETVVAAAQWVRARRENRSWWLMRVLCALAVAQPLANSIRHDMLLMRTDTRTLAKQWIEANIPAGAKIALDWPVHGPPLSTAERAIPRSDRAYDVTIVGGTGERITLGTRNRGEKA
jgi:4-amino-4-deoxy-L-arabinose transferase-like glycosyltransferase